MSFIQVLEFWIVRQHSITLVLLSNHVWEARAQDFVYLTGRSSRREFRNIKQMAGGLFFALI